MIHQHILVATKIDARFRVEIRTRPMGDGDTPRHKSIQHTCDTHYLAGIVMNKYGIACFDALRRRVFCADIDRIRPRFANPNPFVKARMRPSQIMRLIHNERIRPFFLPFPVGKAFLIRCGVERRIGLDFLGTESKPIDGIRFALAVDFQFSTGA